MKTFKIYSDILDSEDLKVDLEQQLSVKEYSISREPLIEGERSATAIIIAILGGGALAKIIDTVVNAIIKKHQQEIDKDYFEVTVKSQDGTEVTFKGNKSNFDEVMKKVREMKHSSSIDSITINET